MREKILERLATRFFRKSNFWVLSPTCFARRKAWVILIYQKFPQVNMKKCKEKCSHSKLPITFPPFPFSRSPGSRANSIGPFWYKSNMAQLVVCVLQWFFSIIFVIPYKKCTLLYHSIFGYFQ